MSPSDQASKDYQEFIGTTPVAPPLALTSAILTAVRHELSPSAWSVFFKLLSIHALSAVITLSICPQFGFRLLGDGHGLMAHFMRFGSAGCMAACGFFFLGTSLLVASLLLQPAQLRVVRERRWVEIGSLAILSLAFFAAITPGILLSPALFWLAGALAGAMCVMELGWRLRAPRTT
jgi:hypothetical protein